MTERMLMLDVKLTTEFVNQMFEFENADDEFAGGLRLPPRGHARRASSTMSARCRT